MFCCQQCMPAAGSTLPPPCLQQPACPEHCPLHLSLRLRQLERAVCRLQHDCRSGCKRAEPRQDPTAHLRTPAGTRHAAVQTSPPPAQGENGRLFDPRLLDKENRQQLSAREPSPPYPLPEISENPGARAPAVCANRAPPGQKPQDILREQLLLFQFIYSEKAGASLQESMDSDEQREELQRLMEAKLREIDDWVRERAELRRASRGAATADEAVAQEQPPHELLCAAPPEGAGGSRVPLEESLREDQPARLSTSGNLSGEGPRIVNAFHIHEDVWQRLNNF